MISLLNRPFEYAAGWSLSTKLVLLVVIPLALTLAITLPMTVTGLNRLESETSAGRLDEEVKIINQQFTEAELHLSTMADTVVADAALLQAIRDSDVPMINARLLSARTRMDLQHLEVVDKNGDLLAQEHRFESSSDDIASQQLKDLAEAEIGSSHMISTSEGFMLTVIKPLKDASGVWGSISVGKLLDGEALHRLNFHRADPVIMVFDSDGRINASSEDSHDVPTAPVPIEPDTKMLMMARAGQVSHGIATFGENQQRAAYAPFPIAGAGDAVFGVAVSVSPAVSLRDELIADYFMVMVPLAIMVLALGYLVTRAITKRILRLRDGAVQIGNGNLDVRIHESAEDEVGTLAHEFNRMADSLSEKATELEEINRNLELRVVERTQALEEANTQLMDMQGQIVRSEKLAALGELSAGVAHDLRNPLGAIRNGVYFLNKKLSGSELAGAEPKITEFLEVMDERVEHCDKIITDLITFARVTPPNYSAMAVDSAVDAAMKVVLFPQNVEVVKRFEADGVEVQADPEQLHRVFCNLAQNSIEAMSDGGVLKIGVELVAGSVEISFSDDGNGIDEADFEKIFDPLFTTKIQGTGLGLSVCQQIIAKHGGAIRAASKNGKGANFTVQLPLDGPEDVVSSGPLDSAVRG